MAVNKNFVVKNGVEVATNLIYAESSTNRVGLGTTTPGAKLDVVGNIIGAGLTLSGSLDAGNAVFTGIATANDGLYVGAGGTALHVDVSSNTIGVNNSSPDNNFALDVQPGAGQSAATLGGALDVQGNTSINGNLDVNGAINGEFTVNLDNVILGGITTANNREIFTQFDVINNSNLAYQFQSTGIGFTQNTDDPTLFVNRGQKYHFNVNSVGYPFYIKTEQTTGAGDLYDNGVEGNGAQVGIVTFYVPYNAPNEIFYQAGSTAGMGNTIYVLKDAAPAAQELNISDLNVSGISTFAGDLEIADKIVHLGDTDTAIRFPAANTFTVETGGSERLRVTSAGNIGIGSDNPTSKLDVNGSATFDGSITSASYDLGSTSGQGFQLASNGALTVQRTSGTAVVFRGFNQTTQTSAIMGDGKILVGGTLPSSPNISLNANGSATFAGSVTASSFSGNADTATDATNSANVQVDGEASTDATRYLVFADTGGGYRRLKADGGLSYNPSTNTLTVTNITGTASNAGTLDSLDSTQFLRSDAADTKTSGDLGFSDSVKATFGTGADLQIYHDNTHSYIKEQGTGELRLGTNNVVRITKHDSETLATFNADGSVDLYHNNVKKFETTAAGVAVSGDVNSTSDINLKKDIEVVTSATEMLNELRGVRFIWKENGEPSLGVIAQEVEAILPELVRGEEGDKSVNYSGLIGVLIEAVKELTARVEELEK